MENRIIFIEGIPGSGKSTLLNALHKTLDGFSAYREGDITPLELAWCAYMNPTQYAKAIKTWPQIAGTIRSNTQKQGNHFVTAYTHVSGADHGFYTYMAQYELYGGRRSDGQFREIVFSRFHALPPENALYECALLQNILEELILYFCYDDAQILEFYRELLSFTDPDKIRVIRLLPDDIFTSVDVIRHERINEQGEEIWFSMMMDYLRNSVYGKMHRFEDFDDLISHFKHRILLEDRILALLPAFCRLDLPSRTYSLDSIIRWLHS